MTLWLHHELSLHVRLAFSQRCWRAETGDYIKAAQSYPVIPQSLVAKNRLCRFHVLVPRRRVRRGRIGHKKDDGDKSGLEQKIQNIPGAKSCAHVSFHILHHTRDRDSGILQAAKSAFFLCFVFGFNSVSCRFPPLRGPTKNDRSIYQHSHVHVPPHQSVSH